ncbi:nucleotidyltransferase domain-containing protein [Streptomyces sp. NPDC047097]|uniref:nucleotidyltransferase domain-containing protein n=1 Tax=Streptomyces sp. NPDC047097 TaxID=3155260 RepID=UPI003403C178
MTTESTDLILRRFVSELRGSVPLVAVWAHGSLALGDFQPGRSDLDLIAVVERPVDAQERERLATLHRLLAVEHPDATRLHCSYLPEAALSDAGTDHLTWAHSRMLRRPVTPISRRELLDGGLTLHGPPPTALLPPLAPGELAAHIRRDLRHYWLPATAKPQLWLQDIWVDLGLLVLARATVTLRDGRLITKAEALDELPLLGAPLDVVDDIRARRYGTPDPLSPLPRLRRAARARAFLRRGIRATLTGAGTSPG